jgi:hypothetical protein
MQISLVLFSSRAYFLQIGSLKDGQQAISLHKYIESTLFEHHKDIFGSPIVRTIWLDLYNLRIEQVMLNYFRSLRLGENFGIPKGIT